MVALSGQMPTLMECDMNRSVLSTWVFFQHFVQGGFHIPVGFPDGNLKPFEINKFPEEFCKSNRCMNYDIMKVNQTNV